MRAWRTLLVELHLVVERDSAGARWIDVALLSLRDPSKVAARAGSSCLAIHEKAARCAAPERRRKGPIVHAQVLANTMTDMAQGEHALGGRTHKLLICATGGHGG